MSLEILPEYSLAMINLVGHEQTIAELYDKARELDEQRFEKRHDFGFLEEVDLTGAKLRTYGGRLDDIRSAAQRTIINTDGLTDLEKAVYTHALDLSVKDRETTAVDMLERTTRLDAALTEGAQIYLTDRDGFARSGGDRLLRVKEPGLQVTFSRSHAILGIKAIGAVMYGDIISAKNITVHGNDEPLEIEIANLVNLGGHNIPEVDGVPGDLFVIGQKAYEQHMLTADSPHNRANFFVAGELANIMTNLVNPLTDGEKAEFKSDTIRIINNQARGKVLGTKSSVTFRVSEYRREHILTGDVCRPEILNRLLKIAGVERDEILEHLSAEFVAEREAILNGEIKGDTWSELDVAEKRLPRLLDQIFANVDQPD